MSNIAHLYGSSGILTACLTDPLSQLINKILGLKADAINCVGFYYEAELHDVNKCNVTLFNIYDNEPVPWLKLGYTMELFLASPFVNKITFYPLLTDSTRTQGKKLDNKFKAAIIQAISNNANAVHDKNISYTILLLKIAGINDNIDHLTKTHTTGYTVVNKALLTVMDVKKFDIHKISSSIIACPLLKQPITISSRSEINNEGDMRYIIEESRREITKLVAVFVDLFTSHIDFKNNILQQRVNNNGTSINNLSKIDELINYLNDSIQNNILSIGNLNDLIKQLGQNLPLINAVDKNIQLVADNIMCSFPKVQQQEVKTDVKQLKELGIYLEQLIEDFNNSDNLTVNLTTLINAYNNVSTKKIVIPKNNKLHTISKNAVITLSEIDNISFNVHNKNICIPMFNANLSSFNESQLLDILVYIDSLRAPDGSYDTRFANLQNEIVHELAIRKTSE